MEELVAGAYKKAGFDEVTVTPRSRDRGRDVIAIKRGVGCIKIIGSVKRYAPGNQVGYDDIRALLGVLSGERDASKGIITTTADFPPGVRSDSFIAPALDTRLELMNGQALQRWLAELTAR
jgi:restriction system protein